MTTSTKIIIAALIGLIVYQQLELKSVKRELNRELTRQIDSINDKLLLLNKKNSELSDKMLQYKYNDSIIALRITGLNKKLKKYEKITYSTVDNIERDSIRAIIKRK